ncbi:Asp-tRNA(Asn)/Glu-tRNA(Gln) amidotransferase GatCAB subunit B [bacterium]|nr:Asp-tRNA(Asn)/Glu-tRNA(Gln) amidotransferase GatCAB subunit B [bacterium]|tara:strand:- start:32569 stop:33984 length:1416 start_codon:yes stop_codon:yes gene_type:complete
MEYKPTIGLEIHAELKTRTKMFCDSKNDPDEPKPNVNICPICMAHPGTLPVINKEAVKHVLRVGTAVGGKLADFTEFDRKNYFYPDLPKGYQISQYKYPLISNGILANIELERIHLEEDTGRSAHETGDYSLVDFNRAGIPLMELVTKPVIETAQQAVFFAKELQLLLRYVGASDANMEKGEMRVEANVSVSQDQELGTKVEVKNLNSFKSVGRAIEYEIKRQSELLDKGEKVVQETRGWDENKGKTFSQRIKEESHDYRYFPDPDLPKLYISEIPEFLGESLKKELPELPWDRRERYKKEFDITDEDIEMYVQNEKFGNLFEGITKELLPDKKLIKLASNYIASDLRNLIGDDTSTFTDKTASFAKLMRMIQSGEISSRGAKDILAIMVSSGGEPEEIVKEMNLVQKSDEGELKGIIEKIIADKPQVVADFKAGKEKSLQFLIGQGMKETKGAANPSILKKLFLESLSKS